MPSQEHAALADLVRERPTIVVPLLRGAGVDIGATDDARLLDPTFAGYAADYAADAAVAILDANATTRLVVLIEVQLARDDEKRRSWPAYEALARARHRASACVLVIAPDPAIARWAARPVSLGPSGSRFIPLVVGPAGIPLVDEATARAMPELAVLSAVAHGNEPDGIDVILATLGAVATLDEGHAKLYLDLVYAALTDSTRLALEARMLTKDYEYRSDFARGYVAQGKAEGLVEGKAEGLAEAILVLAHARKLVVTDAQRAAISTCGDLARLRRWLERVVAAPSIAAVIDE